MTKSALADRLILVVEDEYYAAADLRQELVGAGAQVIGPVPSLEKAMDLIESSTHVDAAILNIRLGGEMVFPAAEQLRERGVPFLFATGYDQSIIPRHFGDVLRCEKPIGPDNLVQALATMIHAEAPAHPSASPGASAGGQ